MTLKTVEQTSASVLKQKNSQSFIKSLAGFRISAVQMGCSSVQKASIHVAWVIVSLYIEVG